MRNDYGYFEEHKIGKTYDMNLLRRLSSFARPYKALLLGSIGLVILITILDLTLPYLTKIAIDQYIVPRINSVSISEAEDTEPKRKMIRIDLSDPAVQAIADQYRHLIRMDDSGARISYELLSEINPHDLAILRKNDIAGLGMLAACFLGLALLNFISNLVQKIIMEYTGQMIIHDLRMKLFAHIQNLSLHFFNRNPVARLVTRVTNDIQNMHELFTSIISFILKDIFLLFGIAGVMLILNWKLALVSFTVLPIVLYAAICFSRRARDIFRVLRINIAEINTRLAETINGIRVIQLFLLERANYKRLKSLNHENYLAGMKQIHVLAVFMPLIEMLAVVSVAMVIFYSGERILTGRMSLGALVVFISYIYLFFRPIRDMAEKYNILQNALASAERIFLILDDRDMLLQPSLVSRHVLSSLDQIEEIRFEDVNFYYIAGEQVLNGISFGIKSGETVAVVGPTGAGKTSLINLVLRFYDPTSGIVRINGYNLRDLQTVLFRSKMALVPQDPFLFSSTIRENIFQDHQNYNRDQQESILQAANCADLIERLPHGLDTNLTEGGRSISSGERQLILIARAFARNPQVILFDEATSYIDTQTELRIQLAIDSLMQNRISLVVAHRLSTVRKADRIIVLSQGYILETGTHDELMDKNGFYHRLHQQQI